MEDKANSYDDKFYQKNKKKKKKITMLRRQFDKNKITKEIRWCGQDNIRKGFRI